MAFRAASNGYLMIGGAVVTKATEFQVRSASPIEMPVTLAGDVGFTSPNAKTVRVEVKNAVAVGAAEFKAIRARYTNNEVFGMTSNTGGAQIKYLGVIENSDIGSKANAADTFDFTFMGVETSDS